MNSKVTVEMSSGGYVPLRACDHCGVKCAGSVWATPEQARDHAINDAGMAMYGHGAECPQRS